MVVYLPYDVISGLGIEEGDDVDFFKYKSKYFIFAKKSDITDLLVKTYQNDKQKLGISVGELEVLKKLDTIRYNYRDMENIKSKLSNRDIEILEQLVNKKIVVPLANKEGVRLYSISNDIYNKYLLRNKNLANGGYQEKREQVKEEPASLSDGKTIPVNTGRTFIKQDSKNEIIDESQKFIDELRAKGYIVVETESEATNISIALEDSIRQGLVVGTRSFNKKFYIALKSFIVNNSTKVLPLLKDEAKSISDISKETGIDEDGIRTMLYILSENGEVTELRRDIFKLA